jgi:hypothetical protein
MKRVFRGVITVFMIAVLNVLSLGIHAAAAFPMNMGHSMATTHSVSSSGCLTICTTATLHREDIIDTTDKDEDDEPQPPFYVQLHASILATLKEQHDQETRLASNREPPPDSVPAYIKLTVFRA